MAGTTTNNVWPYPTDTDYVYLGAQAIEALADAIDTSTGTGLLTWTSYAPTLSGGWANGNGTWSAAYAKIGKIVHVRGQFTVGTTTTKGTTLQISLPVTASATASSNFTSIPTATATVAGGNTNILWGYVNSTTAFTLFALNTAGTYAARTNITSLIPATWATGDVIQFAFTYESAS